MPDEILEFTKGSTDRKKLNILLMLLVVLLLMGMLLLQQLIDMMPLVQTAAY